MKEYLVRNAKIEEFKTVGELMVEAYARLEGFPGPAENPGYFKLLANVGDLTQKPGTEIIIAVSPEGSIDGAVVYFSNMEHYGTSSKATQEKNASGFRLLAVSERARGKGLGKLLTQTCIQLAKKARHKQVIIHSTKYMSNAIHMYKKIGFIRVEDFDFMAGEVYVYGFSLALV